MSRVSELYGYDSNNAIIEPSWDEQTGVAEFDTVPSRVEYLYTTNYCDLKMDVTLTSGSVERDGANGSGGGCELIRNEELGIRNYLILALFLLCFMELALLKKREVKKM